MTAVVECQGRRYAVRFDAGQPIAMPLDPHGAQPAFFTTRPANARPLRSGTFVGSVAEGGSCNAETVELTPHCHGTHTECIGHITAERRLVQDTIYGQPTLARLVSLIPGPGPTRKDSPRFSRAALEDALDGGPDRRVEALIVRTLPNDPARMARDYLAAPDYPVFGPQAMAWLASLPLKHLLVDTPSLDVPHDEGRLANHRTWWGLGEQRPPEGIDPERRSVTEMVFIPDDVADGLYWMHLELSPLLGDATPSRPVLYPAKRQR